VIFSVRARY